MEQPLLLYAMEVVRVVTGKSTDESGAVVRKLSKDKDLPIDFIVRSVKLPSGTKTTNCQICYL